MGQLYPPYANVLTRLFVVGGPLAVFVFWWFIAAPLKWSSWATGQHAFVEQPVPFSHEHHVSGLGIDCRYCHDSVEQSAFAGMPPTETCMSCHSQLWTNSAMLEPVRRSYARNEPIQWNRVHRLADYVYFDHSIHVAKGVGCETCHGRVDQMPLTYQAASLHMSWCLECHRAPEKFIRPAEEIFAFGRNLPAEAQLTLGRRLVREYDIHAGQLTDCSVCHR